MGIEPILLPSEGSVLPLNEHPMHLLTTVVFTFKQNTQPISLHEVRQLSFNPICQRT